MATPKSFAEGPSDIESEKGMQTSLLAEWESKTYGSVDPDSLTADHKPIMDHKTCDMSRLKSWSVLASATRTVWESWLLWKIMLKLYAVSIFTAFVAYNLIPDPGLLDTAQFRNISSPVPYSAVLTVFVSVTLSLFLTNAVSRWLAAVDGFEQIFNSIRMMSLQLHALGAEPESTNKCLRYALLSAHFLVLDMNTVQRSAAAKDKAFKEALQAMENSPSQFAHLTTLERRYLDNYPGDKPYQMWMWIATLLGRMSMEKHIPGMATATYGRIMNLAQQCQAGLRTVRAAVLVQMPYRYVRLVAFLVHLDCTLLAINFGLSLGVSYHGLKQYSNHYYFNNPTPAQEVIPLTTQMQSLIGELLKGVFAPLLYQAFLHIGVTISSPFSTPEAAIPIYRMLDEISFDLTQAPKLP